MHPSGRSSTGNETIIQFDISAKSLIARGRTVPRTSAKSSLMNFQFYFDDFLFHRTNCSLGLNVLENGFSSESTETGVALAKSFESL